MEFNSLDAQRESCEAYVASQRAEGWVCMRERYDDGGFSGGTLDRPGLKTLIEDIEDQFCRAIYPDERVAVRQSVSVSTAEEVLRMMRATVENGTAKKYFLNQGSIFQQIPVAGKTGTLSGDDPAGRYFWFIGTAPVHSPEIAVAALIIEQGRSRIRGSLAARHLLDYYFRRKFGLTVPAVDTAPLVKPGIGER